MRYRIYFEAPDGEESAREVEAKGVIYRVCDDHGRVVFGTPWPEPVGRIIDPTDTHEPKHFA